jgi:hypothetical protein
VLAADWAASRVSSRAMRTVTADQLRVSEGRVCLTVNDIPVSSIEDILDIVSIVFPVTGEPSPDNVRIDWE